MVGSGMMSVGAGGCVGGMIVGGIIVGGILVGGTEVRVAGTDVRVGLMRVEVARPVGEARSEVGKGSRVRDVDVTGKVDVGVGVRVSVGVAVGMVEVIVGGSDGVYVGAVDVGKGPRSAWEVRARAVFVLLAPCSEPRSRAGSPKVSQKKEDQAKQSGGEPHSPPVQ